MVEFLLAILVISILALIFGNSIGSFLGLVGLFVSVALLLIFAIFTGFGALLAGIFALFTNLSLGGGIVLVCLLVAAIVLFVFTKKVII